MRSFRIVAVGAIRMRRFSSRTALARRSRCLSAATKVVLSSTLGMSRGSCPVGDAGRLTCLAGCEMVIPVHREARIPMSTHSCRHLSPRKCPPQCEHLFLMMARRGEQMVTVPQRRDEPDKEAQSASKITPILGAGSRPGPPTSARVVSPTAGRPSLAALVVGAPSLRWEAAQLIPRRSLDEDGHEVPDRPVRKFLVRSRHGLAHAVLSHARKTGDQPLDDFLQCPRFVFGLSGVHRCIVPAVRPVHQRGSQAAGGEPVELDLGWRCIRRSDGRFGHPCPVS